MAGGTRRRHNYTYKKITLRETISYDTYVRTSARAAHTGTLSVLDGNRRATVPNHTDKTTHVHPQISMVVRDNNVDKGVERTARQAVLARWPNRTNIRAKRT